MSTLYDIYALPRGGRCIRVLEILPANSVVSESEIRQRDTLDPILHIDCPENVGDNTPHPPLRFRLKIVDLDTYPDFTALSYVWGVPKPSQPTITYGNTTVTITENCYAALVHLRKALGGFTIWIDAICINQAQENNEEKFDQLLLMGEIYSRAKTAYIWLGEGTPETDRAMQYLDSGGLSKYVGVGKHGQIVSRPWAAVWGLTKGHCSRDRHPVLYRSKSFTFARAPSLSYDVNHEERIADLQQPDRTAQMHRQKISKSFFPDPGSSAYGRIKRYCWPTTRSSCAATFMSRGQTLS
jgi:hypothetical protein